MAVGLDLEALAEAASGAVAGVVSTSILYPLDTCKTKYQAESRSGKLLKYRSPADVLKEALKSNQLISLYQGIGAKNLQSFISQFIYFYSYSYIKKIYLLKSRRRKMGTGANLLVAAAAGACTAVITQPLDTASARMQTRSFGKSQGLCGTLKTGDWTHAFDGLGASLILVSNPAVNYTVFEQLKNQLLNKRRPEIRSLQGAPVVLSALSAFLLGALSKTVATVVTYPAIRCKILLQVDEEINDDRDLDRNSNVVSLRRRKPRGIMDAINIIWHREGAFGFYKGLQAQILKTVLSAALMLMIKEKTSKITWLLLMNFRRWLALTQKRLTR